MDAYKAVTSNIAAVPILKTTSIGSCEAWEATGALRPIEVMADFGSARTDKSHGRLQAHTQFVCHSRSWLARVLAELVKKVMALEQEIACIGS